MSTTRANAFETLLEAGIDPAQATNEQTLTDAAALLERASTNPHLLVKEILRTRIERDKFKRNCAVAADAAKKNEQLLEQLINGNALECRFETLKQGPDGPRAVCRMGGQIRELSLAPTVDPMLLESLQPWDYVSVHENVVVDVWKDDAYLFESAFGEVVSFQGYLNGSRRLARVSRTGQAEEVVRLAEHLCQEELTPRSKLVLMRDNPNCAIASLPSETPASRFEVPISTIDTKLSDLACVEPIAEKLIMEIIKRIVSPEIRDQFNLDALRGLILSSYKPGMGKTAFMRAFAAWLAELGQQQGFDVVLYLVKPNEFKSMWHGEDARIVREELFGSIRARRTVSRERPLVQLLVLDEVDSWGRRPEGGQAVASSAQSDALEALLVELDGMVQEHQADPPSHLLVVGMTNRPDRIDDAIKRPGRMGDEMIDIPDLDIEGAEQVCLIYTRASEIPWQVDGKTLKALPQEEVATRFLRPALQAVFPAVVLRYSTDTQRKIDVTAGEIMASVHYRKAMSTAKNRAAERRLRGIGVPAVAGDDVIAGLLDMALSLAAQMEADPHMLVRHLQIKTPVARVDVTPREELDAHRYFSI